MTEGLEIKVKDDWVNVIKNANEVADIFNRFYLSCALVSTPDIITKSINANSIPSISDNPCSFFVNPASDENMVNNISSLTLSKSSGYDGISTIIVQMCNLEMSSPLTFLINESIQIGTFPSRLDKGLINPIFKLEINMNKECTRILL